MPFETTIHWFRTDLRLHDSEALVEAAAADHLLPVYCFDPREFGVHEYGGRDSFEYRKTGPHRARFLVESVADLRSSLRAQGSELIVRRGRPEAVLPDLAESVDADAVFFHTRPTSEERAVETAVRDRLREREVLPQRFWGHTLYHPSDLPEPVESVDDTFTPFRKRVENEAAVRDAYDVPGIPELPPAVVDGGAVDPGDSSSVTDLDPGEVPSVRDLDPDLEPSDSDERAVLPFEGGESRALERLREYVWERDRLREYKETRNGLLGADYSSKLSPWLNLGCLSPRRVYETVQEYEAQRVANDSTYWLVFELLWRDFFQFQFAKHGDTHFTRSGIRDRTDVDWQPADDRFRAWAAGRTGIPFVDANMRELTATGYMSNRGRQNVASFLANDLGIDWRRGAAYFETHLVDYDPASNYGNWAYVAGVGNDSRDRSFDVLWQAGRYDPDAEYVERWCPELEGLPPEYAHEPWKLNDRERREYGIELGTDYPEPILEYE